MSSNHVRLAHYFPDSEEEMFQTPRVPQPRSTPKCLASHLPSIPAHLRRTCILLCVFATLVFFDNYAPGWTKGVLLAGVEATVYDHKNIVYTLPRPGIQSDEDCYLDMYSEDILRDIDMIYSLGATTIMTWNGWDFSSSHDVFLSRIAKYNISLAITFKPDLDGTMSKKLEHLNQLLTRWKVPLEYLFLDYPLNFDNAEEFFRWTVQVRMWMSQNKIKAPLFIRFFPSIVNTKTIKDLLELWDKADFDAWAVEVYSMKTMQDWLAIKMNNMTKRVFFIYGSDSWNLENRTSDYNSQMQELTELLTFVAKGRNNLNRSTLNTYSRFYTGVLQGYSDTWYLGEGKQYYQGSLGDICPDKNPYIRTSCGGVDSLISFGDTQYSVEHLGIIKAYETFWFFRCITPTPAARQTALLWESRINRFKNETCILSLSVDGMISYYMYAFGMLIALIGILLACCKSLGRDRQRRVKLAKRKKMEGVTVDVSNTGTSGNQKVLK